MRIREIAKVTSAGVVVYLVMAACGAHGGAGSSNEPSDEAGACADVGAPEVNAPGGDEGASPGAGQDTGGLFDAIVNPVKDDDTTSGTRLKAKRRRFEPTGVQVSRRLHTPSRMHETPEASC